VISNTLLISMGVPPAAASGIVHTIKNFTGSVSAVSHIYYRNVDWKLFWRLLIPGLIGGVLGAFALVELPERWAKPLVLGYLAAIGVFLIWRGITRTHRELIGGIAAAPFGGYVAARVSARWMLPLVGTVLAATSLYGLAKAFG
jgi:uncharacterized membrane protein YfcA